MIEAETERQDLWRESVRRHRERERRRVRALWYAYFANIAESLRHRAAEYDRRAEALMEEEPDRG